MSEPLSGSGTAAALGGATVFGLFTGTDFGIVFGAFAGALFVATMPQALSAWRVAAHFLVSFIIGVLGAEVLASWLIESILGFDGAPVDALCAVLVSVVSVKILSFIHQQDIASLVSGVFSRLRGGGGGNVK
ncbi:putative holin [Escherichia coli]